MNNKVLVTGGAGYIGSHACKSLALAGYQPIAYDNFVYGHPWAVQWGPVEQGDIKDRSRLDEVFLRHKPFAVMHFAAFAYVGESVHNPGKYYQNNVVGTLSLLGAMRDHEVNKFVFSSTCATYGIPNSVPITEEHSQIPINPYGMSKLMIEKILDDFDVAHSLRSVSLRYFNAAGADSAGDIGEAHDPETHLIPLVIDAVTGKRGAVTIFGDDYNTPDGTCIRDYIHVTDLAQAHIQALKWLEKGGKTEKFNLGNGKGFSVKDVIDSIGRVTGLKVPYQMGTRRQGDPDCLVGDAGKIRRDLAWIPEYSELDSIIESAWKWHSVYSKKYLG